MPGPGSARPGPSHQRQRNLGQTDKGPGDTTTTINGGARTIGASYQPIEDYGLIGDMHTVALVGKDGSIDFMSFPSFDSPTIFAALLDRRRGGRFSIAPDLSGSAQKQLYILWRAPCARRARSRSAVRTGC